MKGNCEWCQCPADPKSVARFGQAPISLDDSSYLLHPASIPGNVSDTYPNYALDNFVLTLWYG